MNTFAATTLTIAGIAALIRLALHLFGELYTGAVMRRAFGGGQ